MLRHLREKHATLVCNQCDRIFFGSSAFQKHVSKVHNNDDAKEFNCSKCHKAFGRKEHCQRHEETCKKSQATGKKRPADPVVVYHDFNVRQLRSAFSGAVQTWRLGFPKTTDDVVLQLKDGVLKMENLDSGMNVLH